MSRRAAFADEQGASLVFALAFVAFMGVFSVAILAFAGVGAGTTAIAAARVDQIWAADAGMELGIANLRADTSACASSGSRTWPATVVNGRPVSYRCTWVSGGTGLSGSPRLGEYGTVVTGSEGITYSGTATDVDFQYGGSVHSSGPLSFASPTRTAMRVNGNVTLAGPCPGATATVTVTSPGTCTGNVAAPPVVEPTTVYIPSTSAAARTGNARCRVYYPGAYGAGFTATPTLGSKDSSYLASGVYYITSGTMVLQGTVFGGMPGTTTKVMTTASPCLTTDPPGAYGGSGVSFVLGGTGALRIEGADSHVELYARVPGGLDAGATPATTGLSVWAGTDPTRATGSGTYTSSTALTPVVVADRGVNLVVHGLTHLELPSARTQTVVANNADAGSAPVFKGGLVTPGLEITLNAGDTTMAVAGTGGFAASPRVVTLTSTATGDPGSAPTIINATIRPDSSPLVSTWRVG